MVLEVLISIRKLGVETKTGRTFEEEIKSVEFTGSWRVSKKLFKHYNKELQLTVSFTCNFD